MRECSDSSIRSVVEGFIRERPWHVRFRLFRLMWLDMCVILHESWMVDNFPYARDRIRRLHLDLLNVALSFVSRFRVQAAQTRPAAPIYSD